MGQYVITLDTGTTNTRVILWDADRKALATAKEEVGVRNTAIDGNNTRLKAAVKSCLEDVLQQVNIGYDDVRIIIASGMITSNVGLVEIPHCVAPVTVDGLAEAVREVELSDVCPIPITFIPGVKNSGEAIDFSNFEAMDIMRGEEVESAAIIERFPKGKVYLLVLPGSHMKFISVDAQGSMTGCLTSISGELLSSITNHTIIADAVGKSFVQPENYDRDMVLLGYDTARKSGIGRACFSARILNQFAVKDKQKLANYILGVVLESDINSILHSSALTVDASTDVIVGGKDPLRRAMIDILQHNGYFAGVTAYEPESGEPLSAIGAYIIAQKRHLL